MPWKETCYMDERLKFVAECETSDESMTEICARYRVSCKTGYKWLARWQSSRNLADLSRAPHQVAWAISGAQAARIIELRQRWPRFGPCKLKAKLEEFYPEQGWPAPSTIGDLLRRRGLSKRQPRRPRPAVAISSGPLQVALYPNQVWAIDFKGSFRTGDGQRCNPLTISDSYSRFLLCCAIIAPTIEQTRLQMERVLKEHGLPGVMRSDNGSPFASIGAGGLTALSVWWLKLGIGLERIDKGHPEQNGRHERMHGTLKAQTARPPAATCQAQQGRFDRFRYHYNYERPHEALGQIAPARRYNGSPRPYPTQLAEPGYPARYSVRRVRSNGEIKWGGGRVFISEALIGEPIGMIETADGKWLARFMRHNLGIIEPRTNQLRHLRPGEVLAVEEDDDD
jgi:transposase InsO family protein